MATSTGVLDAIAEENLGVYRASPIRLREDVSQEAQISSDYRGRLVYELLQNADDAMTGTATEDDRIVFRLTDTDLWVGNSGRPLDEEDVKGLCGLGASRKGEIISRRRASIGHKGMGFKSVLEITSAPEVFSEDYAFRMAADVAREPIENLMEELGQHRPRRVPVMRFPSALTTPPSYWEELHRSGIRTLFRFPLRVDLTDDQRSLLVERLLGLPVTTILFLKHLERVEISVETEEQRESFSWQIGRNRWTGDDWASCIGLTETGTYKVQVVAEDESHDFLLAHDAEVEIGEHRGGLDTYAWEGIEVSEVSVAALLDDGIPTALPTDWKHFHVFLPTAEPSPYPLLVNGAFLSDLSRQEIRVGDERNDYNRFLMHCVAALFRDVLTAHLEHAGVETALIVRLLDRDAEAPGVPARTVAGDALYQAMRNELATHPFLPTVTGKRLALEECVVPPLVPDPSVGEEFRRLVPEAAQNGGSLPDASLCRSDVARIIVDHGAISLSPGDAASLLGGTDLASIELDQHETGGLLVDPVLRVLKGLWEGLDWTDRDELAYAVRQEPLFPVGRENGAVRRIVTDGLACFYPPRSLKGTVPLERLSFLMQELCWGALVPTERNEVLREELVAWQALFELHEFKFPDVMRASVLPALELDPDDEVKQRLEGLHDLTALAAICQLSGRTPDPERPLRYERLGSNRALFNLSRLPVPCRPLIGDEIEWRPAYRVYLGEDWIGEESVETVLEAARMHTEAIPTIPLLAAPEHFEGLLARFSHLEEASDSSEEDEVGLEEDEEAPPDEGERERWIHFLTWIGVNRFLRPVHFHDVEDRATGWLTTKDFGRPEGWAFRDLAPDLWDEFRQTTLRGLEEPTGENTGVPYFYRAHDLEHIVPLLAAASSDATNEVSRALFSHLALNWPRIERFSKAEAALVPEGQVPAMRQKPPRARDEERKDAGDDLWVLRLRRQDWCPTTHGPRRPRRAWLRTSEVERRFGRQGSNAGALLPLLEVTQENTEGKARGFWQTLGIRGELTPSSFLAEDARVLLERLEALYADSTNRGRVKGSDLRQVIRPAYRNLMELLPGVETATSPAFAAGVLAGAPLLVHDGHGSYRFESSDQVLYADKSGTRERLGDPSDLWTFVLEATPIARGPLTKLMGVRVLEDEIAWSPEPSDVCFDREGIEAFRQGIRNLAPYILARLGAERQEERLQAQDARRLRSFTSVVEPVAELSVRCRLGDKELGGTVSRDAFVYTGTGATPAAFVVWSDRPWPHTTPEEAEGLATALSDLLDTGHFEAFLALINAPSDASRLRLLRLAGASTDLEGPIEALTGEPGPVSDHEGESDEPEKTPGEETGEKGAVLPSREGGGSASTKTPLYRPEELLIEGVPISIGGDDSFLPPTRREGRSDDKDKNGAARGYGGGTDLVELDRLGMYVAMAFEWSRLQREGIETPEIFDLNAEQEQPHARVFDVSSLAAIEEARRYSPMFSEALSELERSEVSVQAPGFDILTLNPQRAQNLDRLVELKSSGINARLQEMSWNEWKTARTSELRNLFYLYLVGNLRSDLGDALPFLRAIHDPFAAIWAEEITQHSTNRSVQLNVTRFEAAEHLDLSVRRATTDSD